MSSELSILKKTLAKYSGETNPTQVTQGVSPRQLDVAFIFDTTGSMYPYLEQVRHELTRLASEVYKSVPNVRMGVVAYGDYCDANSTYVTKVLDLTTDFEKVRSFVGQVEKTGGGDTPEALEEALFQANRLNWRIGSSRAIVLVGDAPPHGVIDAASNCLYGHDYKTEGNSLGQKGVKIYATQCGRDSSTEQVFRWLASQTGGVYLNLENIADLVDLLIGVCMKEVGLLESYTQKLQANNLLTGSKARLLNQLKGSSDA
ncbi:MAG: vWA domain-containing protein [Phormidium sp.]